MVFLKYGLHFKGYNCWILIFSLFPPVPIGLQIMKPCHASSNEMGRPSGGRSAKNPFKSQNQQGPSSKKKGADKQGRKRSKKRQVFIILDQTYRKDIGVFFFHF